MSAEVINEDLEEIPKSEINEDMSQEMSVLNNSNIFSKVEEDEIEIAGHEMMVKYESRINTRFKSGYDSSKIGEKVCLITHPGVSMAAINKLKQKMNVIILEDHFTQEEKLIKSQNVDAIFLVKHNMVLDREMLDFIGDRLKVVGLMSGSYDNCNVRELTRRQIKISSAREVLLESEAELAVCLAITVAHKFKPAYMSWDPKSKVVCKDQNWLIGKELNMSVCGIAACGQIIEHIASRLLSMNVKKVLYNSYNKNQKVSLERIEYADLNELVSQSDFIFVSCPLTDKTKNLFDLPMFKMMKTTCVFINTGKEGVVKTNDLVKALRERLIWGAGIDISDPTTPLYPGHPLFNLDNCFITPNSSSSTFITREKMAILTADNIIAALEGKPMPSQVCFKKDKQMTRVDRYELNKPKRIKAKHLLKIQSDHKYKSIRNI